MRVCSRCTWSGSELAYVSFDRTGDRFRNLPFGQAVCPECGIPFVGVIHPGVSDMLSCGVLDDSPYFVKTRLVVKHISAAGLDGDDVTDMIETIRQCLPLTHGYQSQLAQLQRAASAAYASGNDTQAYECLQRAFMLFDETRPHELFNLMASFGLSQREGVQRLINVPHSPASANDQQRDFGDKHVIDVNALVPGTRFGLVCMYRDQHVAIEITAAPYVLLNQWAARFRLVGNYYAPLGEQRRFLCHLGLTPYMDGKWDSFRHLIRL